MDNNKLFMDLLGIEKPKGTQRKQTSSKNQENNTSFDFMKAIKATLNDDPYNVAITDNGAIGYRTTGKALLDLNFHVSALRSMTEKQVADKFMEAFCESPMDAMLWLFYLRDVRGGLGERRSFRIILQDLSKTHPKELAVVIPYIAEYGRYDDMWCLLETQFKSPILDLIKAQLVSDINGMQENKSISLLGKWLPSINASKHETQKYGRLICNGLGLSERTYRKVLSALRGYLKIVERDMSANRWTVIDYNTIPAKSNLIYGNAFLRHDEERRRTFLDALNRNDGTAKINATTLFPHEIVNKYNHCGKVDDTLENLWKALPDTVKGAGNVMVVADGSGSMTSCGSGGSSVRMIDIANALAIYFSERSSGPYKDNYITFSENPKYVNFSNCKTLIDKINLARRHNEVANTNIQAVFDLILETAKKNNLKQENLPGTVLVISDMQFDRCVIGNVVKHGRYSWERSYSYANVNLFKHISQQYTNAGYKMPRLVFWNINSKVGAIPVIENDMGVALVSGYSTAIVNMVLSNKLDPYEALREQLYSKRYEPIYKALVPFYGEVSEMEEGK